MSSNIFALSGFFAAFLSVCSFLMVLFKLPETVDTTREREETARRPSLLSRRFWKTLPGKKGPSAQTYLLPLVIGFFLLSFAESSLYRALRLFAAAGVGRPAELLGVQFFYRA